MNSISFPRIVSARDPVDVPHGDRQSGCLPCEDRRTPGAAGIVPLALQAAMWRASLRDRRLYRQHFTWKLHGEVDRQLMRQAWEATLRRHEIFSLAMSHDDGNDLFFTKREGSCLVWIEREADGVEEPAGEAGSCFGDEWLEDHLQQVTLVRRPGDRWELHWMSHHAWMDGRSRRIDGADHNGLVNSSCLDRWMLRFSGRVRDRREVSDQ